MVIELKVDYDGNPYLRLAADVGSSAAVSDQVLVQFIRRALRAGVVIKNEASCESRDDYASIRIKGCDECV